ncbi:dihydroorotate dehydrogenase electron transfer subunit [Lactococcus hircilactis]|uniref:Dihydroorotate dehydrogenase B (NAD(+)), electron transfer subunit n=1 Tax=Lactococcus hircilactis TaxID=1494462 RepID=A0A7X2CZQ4_9LACT|nr:dihydroorotate dehydrogenase electron transfer subunit [Lactococcus hircilactis]MQW38814.1 dihydroorotate dehydrogenase electron transfer subunit [Lactococcus hircilactis]
MPILQEMMTIVSQKEVAHHIFEMVLTGEIVLDLDQPGQFLHLKAPNESLLLRRPISISSWDKNKKTCTILYRIGDETSGTYALSALTEGQNVDVMGPLGHGFPLAQVKKDEHILLVGGGIGVPPLYELAKQLDQKGAKITVLLGFASKEVKILEEEFEALAHVSVNVTTDDGSYGTKGHVGGLMDALTTPVDAVYTCGAPAMLKAVYQHYHDLERLYISTESRMACGIGACYACVVHTKDDPTGASGHALKVCEDGPVFNGGEIIL